MSNLVPYLSFDGGAREALAFYAEVFGGDVELHTFAEFGRVDGPGDAIAHGILRGPVELFGSDVAGAEQSLQLRGIVFSLLGTASPEVLEEWFRALGRSGVVLDPLQKRPWGAHDGQVKDRFGLTWLIGYEV